MLKEKLKEKQYLPILTMENGDAVTKENWCKRRLELKTLLEKYSYGKTPDIPVKVYGSVVERIDTAYGGKGVAIIDCMMNLPLLFWASEVTGHPFYKRIAMVHADTTLKYFVRDDYSLVHAFRFSEETGEPVGESNYCGYSNGSCWARGMSWAIYGFAIAYNYTREERYLDASIQLLEKFMLECAKKPPVWDFHLPEFEEQAIDTSAAAVVLCGIIELEKTKSNKKLTYAKNLLKDMLAPYIDYDENVMGVLKEQNGQHIYTSYGDYYLIEALMKENSDIKVW